MTDAERQALLDLLNSYFDMGIAWTDEMRNKFPTCKCGHNAYMHDHPTLFGPCYSGWAEKGSMECDCEVFEENNEETTL